MHNHLTPGPSGEARQVRHTPWPTRTTEPAATSTTSSFAGPGARDGHRRWRRGEGQKWPSL